MSNKFVKKYSAALIMLFIYFLYSPSSLSDAIDKMNYGGLFHFFVVLVFGLIPFVIVAGDIFTVPKGKRISFLKSVFSQIIQWLKFWTWKTKI